MYTEFYGFREKPFSTTPDPAYLFPSKAHREAFAHLLYGIENRSGFIELTGEIGAGKTTVLRSLLDYLSPESYRTALIFNPTLSGVGLMRAVNREFGLPCADDDPAGLLQELYAFLLRENGEGRTAVLVIDEAQNLEPAVLEQVRLVSNLETRQEKLVQIVLAGQPELHDLLRRPELRQLGQRIAVSYHLTPMSPDDCRSYVSHRLEIAGERGRELFTDGAIRRISRFSGGLPRLINLACDRALLLGYTREKTPITAAMAATAIADLRREEKGGFRRSLLLAPAILLLAAACWFAFAPATTSRETEAAPEPLAAAAARELGPRSEEATAREAFNALTPAWHVAPLPPTRGAPATPEQLVRQRGLEVARFSGNLGALIRLDTPALLELRLPNRQGRRYLALTGARQGEISIAPPVAGRSSFRPEELEDVWAGRALLVWKNYLGVPVQIRTGARDPGVARLQGLLRGAGVYDGAESGMADRATLEALRRFQSSRGIDEAPPGRTTLLLLYREGGGFSPPRLSGQGGSR